MTQTITAFFDDRSDATKAVARLEAAGIARSSVTVLPEEGATAPTMTTDASGRATEDRGFWDSLKDMFLPDDDRYAYAEGMRRGGVTVTVRAEDDHVATAIDILEEHGAVDFDEREAAWKTEGWSDYSTASTSGALPSYARSTYSGAGDLANEGSGYMAGTDTAGGTTARGTGTGIVDDVKVAAQRTGEALGLTDGPDRDRLGARATTGMGEDETLKVVEERLSVGKRQEIGGRVRVRSYVVETPVSEQVSLHEERVIVDRRPVDRAAGLVGEDAFKERTFEMEETREVAVVSKEARVVEEVGIRRQGSDRVETVSDTVRSTKVEVEDGRTDVDVARERKLGA